MLISKKCLEETSVHTFSTEASTLGIPVGKTPMVLTVDEKIGNDMPFLLIKANAEMCIYMQEMGCLRIEVYND